VNPNNKFPSWYIQDYALYNDRTDDRRKDGRAVLQWHPTDAVLVTLDDTYSDEHLPAMRYQYSTWFNANRLVNVVQDANGAITNFDYGPAPTDLDSTAQGQYIQNNTLGLNVKWDVNENWTATLDAAQPAPHLNPHGGLSGLNVDVGYGPSYNVNSPNFAANQAAGFPNGYI